MLLGLPESAAICTLAIHYENLTYIVLNSVEYVGGLRLGVYLCGLKISV